MKKEIEEVIGLDTSNAILTSAKKVPLRCCRGRGAWCQQPG